MRRVLLRVLAGLGIAWLAFLFHAGFRVPVSPPPTLPPGSDLVRGAVHVHTTRSDGQGAPSDVLASAKKAGLDFVFVTDHDLSPEPPRREAGVLVLPGVEVNSPAGHVLALGGTEALPEPGPDDTDFSRVRAVGGLTILSHPENRRLPWSGEWSEADGAEVVSGDSLWREARAHWPSRLLPAFAVLPAGQGRAWLHLVHDDPGAWSRYDQTRAAVPTYLALPGHDAHGYWDYAMRFSVLGLYVRAGPLPEDPAAANEAVLAALRAGHYFWAFDGLAPGADFHFERVDRELRAWIEPGPATEGLALRVRLRLDGEVVAEGDGEAAAPFRPGAWRAEVDLTRPWVLGLERTFPWIRTPALPTPE